MRPLTTAPPKLLSPKRRMIGGLVLMLLSSGLVLTTLLQAYRTAASARDVERLSPLSVAALTDAPAGQTVLFEGRISPATPSQFHDFVAYIRETKGKSGWRTTQVVAQALRLEGPDGTIQIVNEDYHLDEQTLSVMWQPVKPLPTERFRGIIAGSQVVIIGQVVQNDDGVGIKADVVAVGHKAEYLAGQRALVSWDNNLAYELLMFLLGSGTFLGYWQQLRSQG